jgi:thioredoxin-like negative regulator of GroEL
MDLARAGQPGLAALLAHLPHEADEKAAILIIRALGDAKVIGAQEALAKLRDDPSTPVQVYHAAVLAHDRLERESGA